MRKLTLVLLALGFLAAGATAQDVGGAPSIQFGLKGGVSLSSASGDISDALKYLGADQSMRMGIGGGVALQIPLSHTVALQPEILYTMRGAKYGAGGEDVTLKYDYIDIPVLLQVFIPSQGSMHPRFFGGPNIGILTTAEISGEGESLDLKDGCKSVGLGLTFGAGLDFVSPTGNAVTLDLRYNFGLSSVFDNITALDEGGEFLGEVSVDEKSNNFGFYIGYMFGL